MAIFRGVFSQSTDDSLSTSASFDAPTNCPPELNIDPKSWEAFRQKASRITKNLNDDGIQQQKVVDLEGYIPNEMDLDLQEECYEDALAAIHEKLTTPKKPAKPFYGRKHGERSLLSHFQSHADDAAWDFNHRQQQQKDHRFLLADSHEKARKHGFAGMFGGGARDKNPRHEEWIVLKELGRGAEGVVEEVQERGRNGRKFARKSMKITSRTNLMVPEMALLPALKHVNIARTYEIYTHLGYIYLVMELCDGTVQSVYHNVQGADNDWLEYRATTLIYHVARGLEYCHYNFRKSRDEYLMHRDIKGENLLVGKDGKFKLGDFGLSELGAHTNPFATNLAGTPGFFAPETYLSKRMTCAADIWALGITVLEMCSDWTIIMYDIVRQFGSPWECTNPYEAVSAMIHRIESILTPSVIHPPPVKLHFTPSPQFLNLLTSMLNPDPLKRVDSASLHVMALAHFRGFTAKGERIQHRYNTRSVVANQLRQHHQTPKPIPQASTPKTYRETGRDKGNVVPSPQAVMKKPLLKKKDRLWGPPPDPKAKPTSRIQVNPGAVKAENAHVVARADDDRDKAAAEFGYVRTNRVVLKKRTRAKAAGEVLVDGRVKRIQREEEMGKKIKQMEATVVKKRKRITAERKQTQKGGQGRRVSIIADLIASGHQYHSQVETPTAVPVRRSTSLAEPVVPGGYWFSKG